MSEVIHRSLLGLTLNKQDIRMLLSAAGDETEHLFAAANQVREASVGNDVLLRGILEISNICERNCLFCGLRMDNGKIFRYRMEEKEIAASARQIRDAAIPTVVLQSGEDSFFTAPKICRLIERIKKETALTITLSLGERPYTDSLVEDITIMKEIGADMLGIGPFIAHPDTPIGRFPNGNPDLVFKILAVARLVTRTTNIPSTKALGTIDPRHRIKALMVGANVVMPDFTPDRYKKHYDIYPEKSRTECPAALFLEQMDRDLKSLGRRLGIKVNKNENL